MIDKTKNTKYSLWDIVKTRAFGIWGISEVQMKIVAIIANTVYDIQTLNQQIHFNGYKIFFADINESFAIQQNL